jgi:hypothetical protein
MASYLREWYIAFSQCKWGKCKDPTPLHPLSVLRRIMNPSHQYSCVELREFIRSAAPVPFKVHEGLFQITIEHDDSCFDEAFAVVRYKKECTVVRETKDLGGVEGPIFRMIAFPLEMPLDLVGFLALVSGALAEEKIPVFAISSYRTDHILVEERHLDKSVRALEKLGFVKV